ncbi:MAG: hypothetical protein ATN33_04780 [Epulopiscium sp. Nele67-Bin001]|nr:MAG: hypothetical protein ATN33_04780 [Epulopiscium sp. Nele67-Bin001]
MACECNEHDETAKCGSDCDCSCGAVDEDFPSIHITFEDSEEEVECDVIGIFEVKDKEYIALTPKSERDAEVPDVYIYHYMDDGENLELADIESDEEYELIVEEFNLLFFGEDDGVIDIEEEK